MQCGAFRTTPSKEGCIRSCGENGGPSVGNITTEQEGPEDGRLVGASGEHATVRLDSLDNDLSGATVRIEMGFGPVRSPGCEGDAECFIVLMFS